MANPNKWSGVEVAVETALATALTVSAITKASPGVVSYTGTDPSNGAYVLMETEGMRQVDNRVFRVKSVDANANTFQLEDEDTTGYGSFASGTASVITFGSEMDSAVGLSASGGDFSMIDITTIHDLIRRQMPGVANPVVYSFECLWDPDDDALQEFRSASDAAETRCIKFTFLSGAILVFSGYVACSLIPVGNAQDKVTCSVQIMMQGRPTVYAA